MNRLIKHGCLAAALALLAAPLAASAQERQVAPPEQKPPERALLLPAIQKAQEPAQQPSSAPPVPETETNVMPHYYDGPLGQHAQQGIEPDEIDAAARGRADAAPASRPAPAAPRGGIDKASPKLMEDVSGAKLNTRQMMTKLEASSHRASSHRRILPITTAKNASEAGGAPTSVAQQKPGETPKYEIEDCGTAANPAICCHHEAGDGSSCNLFIMLCEHHGGTGKGDGESAICSDW